MAACLTMLLMLGGCGSSYDFPETDAGSGAAGALPTASVTARGSLVPPAVARVLESAPAGARLDYRPPDGGPSVFALGQIYQSGLQVPCRIGRSGSRRARSYGEKPRAQVFCRLANQWYAMPPVVVSGL